jgi:hypothetical protein
VGAGDDEEAGGDCGSRHFGSGFGTGVKGSVSGILFRVNVCDAKNLRGKFVFREGACCS